MQSKNALGNLLNRYKAVLKKCHLLNIFGSLALAGTLGLGAVGFAHAAGTFEPTLDDATIVENVKIALKSSEPTGWDTANLGEWSTFVDNLNISSAYTVTDITDDLSTASSYYTTFIAKEKQADGTHKDVTYGVLLKASNNGMSNSIAGIIPRTDTAGNWQIKTGNGGAAGFRVGDEEFSVYDASGTNALGKSPDRRVESTVDDASIDRNFFLLDAYNGNGGAINNSANDIEITGDFIGNNVTRNSFRDSPVDGGAIYNNATITTLTGDFIGNSATGVEAEGGAVYNLGTITTLIGDFIGNNAQSSSGAIHNSGAITTLTGDFIGNSATSSGAIYNSGAITTLIGNFIANRATNSHGGAIYNGNDTITTLIGNFIANRATNGHGGAIYNNATITTLTGDFIGNSATSSGGAIYNNGTITLLTGDFIGNSTNTLGGAIYNYKSFNFSDTISTVSGSFLNNKAIGKGGAIWTNESFTFLSDSGENVFSGNTSDGGSTYNAIYVGQSSSEPSQDIDLTFKMTGTGGFVMNDGIAKDAAHRYEIFITGENAATNTFALNNMLTDAATVTVTDAGLVLGTVMHGSAQYDGNFSIANVLISGTSGADIGTAAYVALPALETSAQNANIAIRQNAYGVLGADRMWAQTAFSETPHTWSTAGGAKDVSAALFIATPQVLAQTSSIIVDGSLAAMPALFTANSATFAANSLLVVDAGGIGTEAALYGTNGKLSVASSAKLHITAAKSGDKVTIVDGFTGAGGSIAADAWQGTNLTTSTALQVVRGEAFDATTGTYIVNVTGLKPPPDPTTPDTDGTPAPQPTPEQILQQQFPGLDSGLASILVELSELYDINSPNAAIQFFSIVMDDTSGLGRNNPTEAVKILQSALQLAAGGASAHMGTSANFMAANTLINYLSQSGFNFGSAGGTHFARVQLSEDGTWVADSSATNGASGVAAGSDMASQSIKNGVGLWLSPMYKYSTVQGVDAGAFKHGYDTSMGGLALGADYTVNNAFRVGLAFNLGTGYAESTGDLSQTQNNFDFWGLSLYGAYYKNNFSLMADVGFTSVFGEINQDVPAILGSSSLEANIQSTVWTAGLMAEYTFKTDFMNITPHAGLRYMHVHTGGYDTKNGRGTIAQTEGDSQSIWYFPVGVTFSKDFTFESGWTFTPKLDVGFIAAAGDLHATSVSSIPGVAGNAEYTMQNVDGFAFNGGVGFDLANADNGVSIGLNYNIQASEHETGHMLNATFRYEF